MQIVNRYFTIHFYLNFQKVEYAPDLLKIIENLESTLGATLGLPQSGINITIKIWIIYIFFRNLSTGIQSIQEELSFWQQITTNSPTKSDKEKANVFAGAIAQLNHQVLCISSDSLKTIDEFLDRAHQTLDDIWRLPFAYPQNRMKDMLDIICMYLLIYLFI